MRDEVEDVILSAAKNLVGRLMHAKILRCAQNDKRRMENGEWMRGMRDEG